MLCTEHPSMTVGAPQQILLLCRMRAIRRNVVHVGAVASDFPRHCAYIPSNQFCYFSIAESIHIIFPYTTPLFYAKMMVVHTVPSLWFSYVVTLFCQGSVWTSLFSSSVALDSIIHRGKRELFPVKRQPDASYFASFFRGVAKNAGEMAELKPKFEK